MGPLKEETKGVEDKRVGCLEAGSVRSADSPCRNCGGSSEAQAFLLPPARVALTAEAPGWGWIWPEPVSQLTSDFSKQVTVMRMLSKSVQLHRSTYIPSSLPSCRSLLMAYSVLEGERGRESELTPNRSTPNPQDVHFPQLPQVWYPLVLPVLGPNVLSCIRHEVAWGAEKPQNRAGLQGREGGSAHCPWAHLSLTFPHTQSPL